MLLYWLKEKISTTVPLIMCKITEENKTLSGIFNETRVIAGPMQICANLTLETKIAPSVGCIISRRNQNNLIICPYPIIFQFHDNGMNISLCSPSLVIL